MSLQPGKSIPAKVISEPKIQMAEGFTYFYFEDKYKSEIEVGKTIDALVPRLQNAWTATYGDVIMAPMCYMFIDIEFKDEHYYYDVQVGCQVKPGLTPKSGAQIRNVPPTLVAAMLVWGSASSVPQSYGPLLAHIESSGYDCAVGWREWYVYDAGPESENNIAWIQHEITPKSLTPHIAA
jgi:hypothetical protein